MTQIDSGLELNYLARKIARVYGFTAPATLVLYGRSAAHTYEVRAGRRKFFLKVYPVYQSNLHEQVPRLELTARLRELGVPMAVPMRAGNGKYHFMVRCPEGERMAILVPALPGAHSDQVKEDAALRRKRCGRLAAQIHLASKRATIPRGLEELGLELLVERPLRHFKRLAPLKRGLAPQVHSAALWIKKELSQLRGNAPAWGVIHGDFHPFNIMYDGKGGVWAFDMDYLALGHQIYDLATYLWTLTWNLDLRSRKGLAAFKEQASQFLEGYQQLRKLSGAELKALPAMMAAREMWIKGELCELEHLIGTFYRRHNYWENFAKTLANLKALKL